MNPSPGKILRRLLDKGMVAAPGAFNALAAKLIESQGFPAVYISGAGLSNGALGLPDTGVMTRSEAVSLIRPISQAVKIPVIADADTGFGDVSAVEETVQAYEQAGTAGLHLEDQEFPKRCGHLAGKTLISCEAMEAKIRAACRARKDPDFLIIARTDARSVEGFEASVQRALRYRAAGADMIFPEALESQKEFADFARLVPGWLMANMTEFGKTPYLTTAQFARLGYRLVIFPLSLLRASLAAMKKVLVELKRRGSQKAFLETMMTRKELYNLLDYQP